MESVESNGARPLSGWVIASCHGQTLIGKPKEPAGTWGAWVMLSPVYQLLMQMQPGANPGTVNIVFKAMPMHLLFSIKEVAIPADSLVVLVDSLDKAELTPIHNAVLECEDMMRQTRAARAGLVLKHMGPIPPLKDILKGGK